MSNTIVKPGITYMPPGSDIFDDPGIICITVNCIGAMGKGIALQAKQRDPQLYAIYREMCSKNMVQPGKPRLCIKVDDSRGYKYLLAPTKYNWRYPSKYYWVESILRDIKAAEHKLQAGVAIPALGCANGKLDWARVNRMIQRYLGGMSVPIRVYPPQTHK